MSDGLPRTMLFDMDDTILASETLAERIWEAVCANFGPMVDGLDAHDLHTAIRGYRRWYWKDPERHRRGRLNPDVVRLMAIGGLRRLGMTAPSLAKEMAEEYCARRNEAVAPFPGALDTLGGLRDRGVRMGLITNGHAVRQRTKIVKHRLDSFFECIVVEGEFGIGKPDERVYLHALNELDTPPQEAWMVGDNLEWEVAAPQRLGIFGVWVDLVGKGVPESSHARPDRIIRSLRELLQGTS